MRVRVRVRVRVCVREVIQDAPKTCTMSHRCVCECKYVCECECEVVQAARKTCTMSHRCECECVCDCECERLIRLRQRHALCHTGASASASACASACLSVASASARGLSGCAKDMHYVTPVRLLCHTVYIITTNAGWMHNAAIQVQFPTWHVSCLFQ